VKLLLKKRLTNRDYKNCDVRAARFKPYFFHNINGLNKWLYMAHRPITLQVQCNSETISRHVIQGTGTITFSQNCRASTEHTELVARYVNNGDDNDAKIIHFDLQRYRLSANDTTFLNNTTTLLQSLNELTPIRQDLARLQTQIDADSNTLVIPEHDYHNSDWYEHLSDWWVDLKIVLYFLLVCAVATLLIYVKRCLCSTTHTMLPVFKSTAY